MNQSGLVAGLYMISEWIMRFSVINLLWIIFNVPIVFILFNMLFIEQIEDMIILIISIIILLPIIFFPATIAMFATVRDWVMKEKDSNKLIKSYWQYYKENYKRSFLGGILLTITWTILAADIYYFSNKNPIIMYFFIIMGIIIFVTTINFFSFTVHYHMKLFTSLKNALLMTVVSPVLFVTVAISSGVILYISFNVFQFFLLFFSGSLLAFLSFSAFYRHYLNLMEKGNK